ncbi:transcription/translation regulatory transformer protein RfaH [Bordetella sp. 2513F-2]
MAMHWYLIHTKPRQERIALQNLEQQGYACYLPVVHVERLHQGRLAVAAEPLFPRYLFIQLDTGSDAKSWSPLRSTRGVSNLVSFGTEPARIDAALVAQLQACEAAMQGHPQRRFDAGQIVRFNTGALAGLEGVYEMPDGEQRAMVLIEILSKPVRVRVPQATLRAVGDR